MLRKSDLKRLFAVLRLEGAIQLYAPSGFLTVAAVGPYASGVYTTEVVIPEPEDYGARFAADPLRGFLMRLIDAMSRGARVTLELKGRTLHGTVGSTTVKLPGRAPRDIVIPPALDTADDVQPRHLSPKGWRQTQRVVSAIGGTAEVVPAQGGGARVESRDADGGVYYLGWVAPGHQVDPIPVGGRRERIIDPEGPQRATAIEAYTEGDRIKVTAPYLPAWQRLANEAGGTWTGDVWAFPKSARRAVYRALAELESGADEADDELGGLVGDKAIVLTAGTSCPVETPARYRLCEVEALVPSHDPDGFYKRPDYPADVQERRYHKDKAEQSKVLLNASPACFVPALLLNTDPTAIGGTPIATDEGVVLGGNSRTMTLQAVYRRSPEGVKRYRRWLLDVAGHFGFTADDVKRLDAPVVVRVLDSPPDTAEGLSELVRAFNEPFTQALDDVAEAVALAKRIPEAALETLRQIPPEVPFSTYLASAQSKVLIGQLTRARVLTQQQVNRLLSPKGQLNAEGRALVERVLMGLVLSDADLVEVLTPRLRGSLIKAAPAIVAAGQSPEWDVRRRLPDGVRLWASARSFRRPVADVARQVDPFSEVQRVDAAAVLLAQILANKGGPKQMQAGFRRYQSAEQSRFQTTLFGAPPRGPVASLADSFGMSVPVGAGITPSPTFDASGAGMGEPEQPTPADTGDDVDDGGPAPLPGDVARGDVVKREVRGSVRARRYVVKRVTESGRAHLVALAGAKRAALVKDWPTDKLIPTGEPVKFGGAYAEWLREQYEG